MPKPDLERVREYRRVLANPYACIEYLEEESSTAKEGSVQVGTRDGDVASSRVLLENPYAYLDGNGSLSAAARVSANANPRPALRRDNSAREASFTKDTLVFYSDEDIEAKVREIHQRLWHERAAIWGDAIPRDPIDMLDPAVALSLVGFECDVREGLGQFRTSNGVIEVAGLIDRKTRTVQLSRQFSASVRRFTAAHELGHAVLHPMSTGVHRDKPLDGTNGSRERAEVQADKFATHFLMPAKLVRSHFLELFRVTPFVLTDDAAFALSGSSASELERECRKLRDLSRRLAGAVSYDGRDFDSLAARFGVSQETMAIRLEELGLVTA